MLIIRLLFTLSLANIPFRLTSNGNVWEPYTSRSIWDIPKTALYMLGLSMLSNDIWSQCHVWGCFFYGCWIYCFISALSPSTLISLMLITLCVGDIFKLYQALVISWLVFLLVTFKFESVYSILNKDKKFRVWNKGDIWIQARELQFQRQLPIYCMTHSIGSVQHFQTQDLGHTPNEAESWLF